MGKYTDYTAPPWKVSEGVQGLFIVPDDDGRTGFIAYVDPSVEGHANARLIAAAPGHRWKRWRTVALNTCSCSGLGDEALRTHECVCSGCHSQS